ncbi:MAG: APC family permease [Ktedonobacteraceae bacterium]
MSESTISGAKQEQQAAQPRLRANSMGWLGAAALGAIIMSPAGGIYFNFGPMVGAAGAVAPFIFFVAMLASLPTALSFAVVSREMPSAGSVYAWVWNATSPSIGLFVGWVFAGFYLLAMIVLPGIFGLFFNEFLSYFGVATGYGTWVIGVLLVTAVVVLFDFLGIKLTVRGTEIFMLVESLILLALAITILSLGGYAHQLSFQAFNPGTAVGGGAAIFGALIFGIQANVGYDAVATMAEETRTPKRFIPLATLVAVIVVGLYWIVVSWGFSISVPASDVVKLLNGGFTPITPIARIYWGPWNLLITISAMTSITGIYIAQTAATSRALYAMGREGALPRWLGRLNPQYRVPWNAMTLGIILTTAVTLILGAILGLANQYTWTGTMTSFLGLLTYFAVNVVNIVFFRRFRRDKFNWLLNGVVPAFGMLIVLYILYNSYLASLWAAGWAYGQSVQLAVVIWLLLGIVWTLWQRNRNPSLFHKKVEVFEDSLEPPDAGTSLASEKSK